MNLPNYFLADLSPEAVLSPSLLGEACQTLKRNRERYLAARSTASMVHTLSSVAKDWLDTDYRFRRMALDEGPTATGFSKQTLEVGLNSYFRQLTTASLNTLVLQDLGHSERIDKLCATSDEQKQGRTAMVSAPELLAHIGAGNLPPPTLTSIVIGILARSAQFVKCARGSALLPRLFAHSLYEADPKLGACLELAEWHGGHKDLERVLLDECDCVTVTGSDETLSDLRQRVPARVRFLGYGQRLSFGFVAGEVLGGFHASKVVSSSADDIVAWDQLGCLSPQVIYVQHGGGTAPDQFAELLARELQQREQTQPRGNLPAAVGAAIACRRSIYELRAAHSAETRLWTSQGSTAWTVVYEADPRFQSSCLHRFIYVKAVDSLADALRGADSIRGQVSTVGLAVPEHKAQGFATELARWGAMRVCQLGQMQNPPLTWRHDGRPSLGDLVTWTDWEM